MKNEYPVACEYLGRVQEAERRVDSLRQRIINLRMLLTDTSAHFTDVPHSGASDLQKHESIQAEIDEMEREIIESEAAARAIRLEVGMTVCRLSDPTGQKVLIHRFIEHKEWKDVAGEIGYGLTRIYKYRDEMLAELERMLTDGGITACSEKR